jgi:serine/threonine protein kinase
MHGGCTDIIWKDEDTSGKEESSNMDCTLRLPATPDSTLLKNSTYEQLLTEIARRNLDVEDEAIFELLKKTYNIQKQIGKGSSGVVHQVYHKDLNKRFACKVIEKSGPINDFQSMKTEIEIMRRVTHPRIISLHELYESPKCMWLILELVDAGGLRSKLSSMKRKFPEHLTVKFTKQILEGLHYLHNQGIIHRDIKIDNILFEGTTQTGSVKIADFGLSALMESGENGYSEDPLERKKYRGLHVTRLLLDKIQFERTMDVF